MGHGLRPNFLWQHTASAPTSHFACSQQGLPRGGSQSWLWPCAHRQSQNTLQLTFVGTQCWPLMCACLCTFCGHGGVLSSDLWGLQCWGVTEVAGALGGQREHRGAGAVTETWEASPILRGGPGKEAQGSAPLPSTSSLPCPCSPKPPPAPPLSSGSLHGLPHCEGRGNFARDLCKNRCISG